MIRFTLYLYLVVLIVSLGACKEDPCASVVCFNGGSCSDGTCDCTAGYEGDDCGTEMREKFLGGYTVSEICNGETYAYTMNITESGTSVSNIFLVNFGGLGFNAEARVNGSSLVIPSATIDVQGEAVTYEGSGSLSGNILTITYTIVGPSGTLNCVATCTL
jgi:hypothetical protein